MPPKKKAKRFKDSAIKDLLTHHPRLISLPSEILINIVYRLDRASQACLSMTSKRLHSASQVAFLKPQGNPLERLDYLYALSVVMKPSKYRLCSKCMKYKPKFPTWAKPTDDESEFWSSVFMAPLPKSGPKSRLRNLKDVKKIDICHEHEIKIDTRYFDYAFKRVRRYLFPVSIRE